MTPAVSRGIIEALQARALTATSVMTTSSWWPESATALRPYAESADIGLHLNLTNGAPLGPMPQLAPDGSLPPIETFLRARQPLPLAEIEAEIGRQIDAFVSVWEAAPHHVDGHQHVHALRPVRALVLRQLARRGYAGRVWVRDSGDRIERILRRGSSLKKALGLAWLARGMGSEARTRGLLTNDGFAGFSDFRSDQDYASLFERYLTRPGPRHLIMCHPGYVDDALRAIDPVTDSRERELAFLTSPRFSALLEKHGATLVKLSQLARDQGRAQL